MFNKRVVLGRHEYNTTHFNLDNIKYKIYLEIIFFTSQKAVHTLQVFNPHSKNIVQQNYNIHLEISFLHFKRSAYISTQIQNNKV